MNTAIVIRRAGAEAGAIGFAAAFYGLIFRGGGGGAICGTLEHRLSTGGSVQVLKTRSHTHMHVSLSPETPLNPERNSKSAQILLRILKHMLRTLNPKGIQTDRLPDRSMSVNTYGGELSGS